jgi:hypothetical protein
MKTRFFLSLFAACFLGGLSSAFAGDVSVTRYFSGLWEQHKQESQGIMLQVIDQEVEGMPRAVAYWFTYGDDQQTAWYMAIGHVEGNQVLMDLYTAYDVNFMQPADDAVEPVEVTGTLDLTFQNCNKGVADYTLGEVSGSFDIRRLAGLYNGRCTGGISDNTPGGAKPLKLEVDLYPPVEGMEGEGEAKFWERSDRSDFHVSVEDLADGLYDIAYCDVLYEEVLSVVDGEGAVQFRSPEAMGKILLTEDPRDCQIDVKLGMDTVLTSGDKVLGEKEKGPKDDDDDEDGLEIEVELENTGVAGFEEAEGEVEYEVKTDIRKFEVEIEDVAAGSYGFFVAGTQEGTIEVNPSGKGKLKFSDPQEDDRELLGFDPLGEMIEVRNADNVAILEVAFPDA